MMKQVKWCFVLPSGSVAKLSDFEHAKYYKDKYPIHWVEI